jgi:hypothetical protein
MCCVIFKARYNLWRQNNPEVKYTTTPISRGRGVFLEKESHARKKKRLNSLGTWNVRRMYRVGSLRVEARKLGRYELDIVRAQQVRLEKGGTVREFFLRERE